MTRLWVAAFVIGLSQAAPAAEFTGKVVSVHDGDTARIRKADGAVENIRFVFCDAPEIDQPHGVQARDFVSSLIKDRQVSVRWDERDRYDRIIGEIFLDRESINRKVIEEGHAWWFYHYNAEDVELGYLESKAKSQKKGLWAARAPIYPRAWREGARTTDGAGTESVEIVPARPDSPIVIQSLLPNPNGRDENNETVTLANRTAAAVSIARWKLEDDDGGVFALSGSIPANGTRTIRLNASLLLGNSGDTVRLRNPSGVVVQETSYGAASSGQEFRVTQ